MVALREGGGVAIKTQNERLRQDWFPWTIGDLPLNSQPDATWGISTHVFLPPTSWEALQWLNQKPESKGPSWGFPYWSLHGTQTPASTTIHFSPSLLSSTDLLASHPHSLIASMVQPFLLSQFMPSFPVTLTSLVHVPTNMPASQFLDQYFSNHPFHPFLSAFHSHSPTWNLSFVETVPPLKYSVYPNSATTFFPNSLCLK